MDSTNTAEIEISFHSAESATMEGGVGAYIFYFGVKNPRPKRAKLFVSPSIYLTQEGEEVDQDVWLAGLGNGVGGFTLSSGTFKKIGCVFYKSKLPRFSSGDKIRLTAWVDGSNISHEILFECTDAPHNKFQLSSSSQEPRAANEQVLATPAKSDGGNFELTHLVERFEILEDDFGVSFEGLYFTWSMDYQNRCQVNFNFDVVATNRDRINEILTESGDSGLTIQTSFYNQNGQLISTDKYFIYQKEFPGFCSITRHVWMDDVPTRIRLFPVNG